MAIDHRQLRYFIEVATLGSINRAAARLHIAQPALSRRMAQLEHDLGTQLFVRDSQGVSLTAAGRKLLGRAAALVDELQGLRNFIDAPGETDYEQVQIGMVPGPSLILLTRLLAEFHRRRPDVLLQVIDGTSPQLCELVLGRGLDVALCTEIEPTERLATETLWREAIFLVGPPGLAQTPERMFELSFVMPTPTAGVQTTIEAALARFGVELKVDATVAATATVKQLVSQGSAYTVLPFSTLAEGNGLGVFATLQVPDIRVRRDLVWRAGEAWSEATRTLIELVRETAADVVRAHPDGSLIAVAA